MINRKIMVLTIFLLVVGSSQARGQLKQIRFSVSSISVTEIAYKMAQLKGFYRDEGLDVEMIVIRGAIGIPALVGGSVDYASAAGAIIAAAMRGINVKLVLVVSSRPQFDLVAAPEIKSLQQLKGKSVGISSRGGAVDLLTQTILSQNGLVPHKDVNLLVIGTPEEIDARAQDRACCRLPLHAAAPADPPARRV